jgi:hypothetical protein
MLRRRFYHHIRFSLRGILLLLTLACLYLGIRVCQYREVARVTQLIRQTGGGIGYGYAQSSREGSTFSEPQSSWTFRLLIGASREDQISSIWLYDDRMVGRSSDEFLAQLAAHKDGLSNLREISFNADDVTNVGVKHLAVFLHLEYLDLSNTKIDDASVPALARLSNLRALDLAGTEVSGEGVSALRKLLPRCRTTN